MKKQFFILISIGVSIFCINSCKKETPEPTPNTSSLTPVELKYPSYFPQMVLNPANPMSAEGVKLGRYLYYDTLLSNTGQSCSSCHNQNEGFTAYAANSLPHVNLGWGNYFLWNGQIAGTLEDAMQFEVNDFFHTDISRFENNAFYQPKFDRVFGTGAVTAQKIEFALGQFLRTVISSDSKFDRYQRYEENLTLSELNGMTIFYTEKGDCFHCHTPGLFTDGIFHNNGIDSVFNGVNAGRYNVTGYSSDLGKFKSPTLRNIELTAPYMHDGRYQTLEAVVEFYNSGVHFTPTVDPIMTKPAKLYGLLLSTQEKADLVAFLKTLTDTTFTNNPDFSNPF
ncbi:cytochrome c peroxidase [soil metagenome]